MSAEHDTEAEFHQRFAVLRDHVVSVVEDFAVSIVRQLEVLEPQNPEEAAPISGLIGSLAVESGSVVADAFTTVVGANQDEGQESDTLGVSSDSPSDDTD